FYRALFVFFFFFSSRRRHTRFSRDWSSDVCSSDLARRAERQAGPQDLRSRLRPRERAPGARRGLFGADGPPDHPTGLPGHLIRSGTYAEPDSGTGAKGAAVAGPREEQRVSQGPTAA